MCFSLWVFSTTWNCFHIWHSLQKYFYQHHVTIANDSLHYDLGDQQKHRRCHGHMMNNAPAGQSCIATVVITGTVCLVLLTVGQVCTMGNPFEKVKAKRLRQAVWKLAVAREEGLAPVQDMVVKRLSLDVSAVQFVNQTDDRMSVFSGVDTVDSFRLQW